ncbi:MAG TPA: hypothetical protein VK196_05805 [Magnetospirillum sp.]|nr:hypothetical protein [Magnetospirillum sp.]
MMKAAVPAGVATLLLAVLAATNPSEPAHTRALVEHAKKSCLDNRLVKEMCGGVASLASLALIYEDHMLYSTAHVGDLETVGVLGRVMVVRD